MPHVIVKLWPGKSEKQKVRLADEITRTVMGVLDYGEESVLSRWKKSLPENGWTRFTSPTSSASRNKSTKSRDTHLCNISLQIT